MNITRVRGFVFRSAMSACRVIGIHPTTMQYHLNRGSVDRAGLRRKKRPCEIDGVDYPTLTAAAQATGRHVSSIWRQVEREARSQ